MPSVLICSHRVLEEDLRPTCLWRDGIDRHRAARSEEARQLAASVKPGLVVVDRDLPGSVDVEAVRTTLRDVAEGLGVGVSMHQVEADEL